MSVVPNHALRQLRAGKLAVGMGVQQARTAALAQIAKTAGFDWMQPLFGSAPAFRPPSG